MSCREKDAFQNLFKDTWVRRSYISNHKDVDCVRIVWFCGWIWIRSRQKLVVRLVHVFKELNLRLLFLIFLANI